MFWNADPRVIEKHTVDDKQSNIVSNRQAILRVFQLILFISVSRHVQNTVNAQVGNF